MANNRYRYTQTLTTNLADVVRGTIASTYACAVVGGYSTITLAGLSWVLVTDDPWPTTLPGIPA